MPKNGRGMDFYDDPLWEWNKPYLKVEDVRPVDEQGDVEVWGVPEALNQYIFQFLTAKKFFCSYRGFPKVQNAASRTPGVCFLMPIRSNW